MTLKLKKEPTPQEKREAKKNQRDMERYVFLMSLRPGNKVTRMLAGVVPMTLTVTDVTPSRITCGDWVFNRATGEEIDEDISVPVSHLEPYKEP